MCEATKITWRRHWDGEQHTGLVVREVPEHNSVVARDDQTGREVVVHQTNINAAAGVVFAKNCFNCGGKRPITLSIVCARAFRCSKVCGVCGEAIIAALESEGYKRVEGSTRFGRVYSVRPVAS